MCEIKIGGRILECNKGELLSDILIKNKIKAEHPCGCKGICKKCTVLVNGEEALSCRYIVNSDITVELPVQNDIQSETGVRLRGVSTDNMCFCLDIGTTTLALALVSIDNRAVVKTVTATNPQRSFGADIISRIEFCRKNSVDSLHKVLISEINNMTDALELTKEIPMFVSGNTTMLHTFFNIDCSSIGVSPYKAQFLESKKVNGKDLRLCSVTEVISLPGIHPFVGADLVAGLNCVNLPRKGKYSLLIDIGTNAEILLFSNDKALCTAAAAGPCFEGTNISCGMSATNGAICSYANGEFKTIGNMEPKGICGTGLIDITAYLLIKEEIDVAGLMENKFYITDEVYLSPEDVRQYQLAKSAIYSATETLLQNEGLDYNCIDTMYISGGFSSEINIGNAVITGLLPRQLRNRTIAINNSSLQGTIKFALEGTLQGQLIRNTVYVDLSSDKVFSELFMKNMFFNV